MAYTHARGVVHRDLKPGNVMIGAFGEAQILDWGLAKVLPRGGIADERAEASATDTRVETLRHKAGSERLDSRLGTVMGTPAYMPPEQALGQVHALDKRSDVFSMGAILCVILTGKPPYPGDAEAARRRAAACDLEDAQTRLESCGADRELVDLCLACMAPNKADRPRNAGVLAERMSAYLASVEERAREAQIAAAETRVRAREERKRILLGAVAFLIIVVGGSGWYGWIALQRRDRLTQTEATITEALQQATRLSGQAESTGDPATWREALGAVQAAQLVLDTREATGELGARVALAANNIAREASAARARADQETRNRELLGALHEVRVPEQDIHYSTDWSGVTAQYRAAFSAAGMKFDELPVDEAAALITNSGIEVELAAALDEWAAASRATGDRAFAGHLTRIARAADLDPTRDRLRTLINDGAHDELADLARDVSLEDLPSPTLILFANAVGDAGLAEEAVRTLEFACRRFPSDYVSLVQLARWLSISPDPPGAEIAGLLRAALALRPGSVEAQHELGQVYEFKMAAPGRALEMYREGARQRPEDGHLLFHVGSCLAALGRLEEAITTYRESLRLEPASIDARCNLALSLRALRDEDEDGDEALEDEALELLRDAVRRDPDHFKAQLNLAAALLAREDYHGAIRAYREGIRTNPDFVPGHNNLGLVLAGRSDYEGARTEFLEVLRLEPEHATASLNLGVVCMNLGDLEGALQALREGTRIDPESVFGFRILGHALSAAKDPEGALVAYRRATELGPTDGASRYELGTELYQQRRFEEAAEALGDAIRCSPNNAQAWCNLGLALQMIPGRATEALEALRRGDQLGSSNPAWAYPTQDWIEEALDLVELEQELAQIKAGTEPPVEPARLRQLARLARDMGHRASAAELYARLSSEDSSASILGPAERVDAARCAASANSEALDGPEAARYRELVLRWLREELSEGSSALLAAPADEGWLARLEQQLAAPEFAPLREPRALSRLPQAERSEWLEHWRALRARLAAVDGAQ
jgi:serine/threonine-protein kinase